MSRHLENRYARKRAHKRALKKRHAMQFSKYYPKVDELKQRKEYEKEVASPRVFGWTDPRNGGYDYWSYFSLSGERSFAKRSTNRRIRARFRTAIANQNLEDIMAMNGGQYEKEFDYWWTIY